MPIVSFRMVAAIGLAVSASAWGTSSFTQSETREPVTVEQFDVWMEELSNWGRWGDDDELGAANLMTEAKRLEAAGLVRESTTVSLAHDMLTEEAADVAEPFVLQMTVNGERQNSADRVEVYFHGVSFSHLDGLCHVFYKDRVFNGLDYREVVTDDGCSRMDTTAMKNGLVTRAVLIDMPRLKGVPFLEPGTKLYQEDIEAWEEYAGVTVGSGDALMGADSVHEAPESVPGLGFNPIHRFAIVSRGMNLLDNLDLDAAAETAARLNRWEFMIVVAPLRVPGGTGSPVNPIAIF